MTHLFVPYEIAEKLNELDFQENCIAFFNSENKELRSKTIFSEYQNQHLREAIAAPLFQQVIDWLRDKHNIELVSLESPDIAGEYEWTLYSDLIREETLHIDHHKSYYDALTDGIWKAIELIETAKKQANEEQES